MSKKDAFHVYASLQGVNTPAVLLCVGLLQRLIELERGEEPFRGSRIPRVQL